MAPRPCRGFPVQSVFGSFDMNRDETGPGSVGAVSVGYDTIACRAGYRVDDGAKRVYKPNLTLRIGGSTGKAPYQIGFDVGAFVRSCFEAGVSWLSTGSVIMFSTDVGTEDYGVPAVYYNRSPGM